MIFISIFTAIILIGLLIASSNALMQETLNKRKNSELFKQLGKHSYEPITPGFSLEELDSLSLDDERIVREYENITNMLREKFGITVRTHSRIDSLSHLWRYTITSKYKGDFLNSDKNYSTRQKALRAAFIHVLKEKWI
jgi:hypothetical protein